MNALFFWLLELGSLISELSISLLIRFREKDIPEYLNSFILLTSFVKFWNLISFKEI